MKRDEMVTFTEEILNGKLHFLCSAKYIFKNTWVKKFPKIFVWDLSVVCLNEMILKLPLLKETIPLA